MKKHSKADNYSQSNYNSNNSNNSNNFNFKRKRFNSDGGVDDGEGDAIENPYQNTKIVISEEIKFRYSMKDMNDIYLSTNLDSKPQFTSYIEEICSNNKRKIINVLLEENDNKRDRSNTINYQAYEFKSKFSEPKKSINLPKNNRKICV